MRGSAEGGFELDVAGGRETGKLKEIGRGR